MGEVCGTHISADHTNYFTERMKTTDYTTSLKYAPISALHGIIVEMRHSAFLLFRKGKLSYEIPKFKKILIHAIC